MLFDTLFKPPHPIRFQLVDQNNLQHPLVLQTVDPCLASLHKALRRLTFGKQQSCIVSIQPRFGCSRLSA
jgi:hypothetical protein